MSTLKVNSISALTSDASLTIDANQVVNKNMFTNGAFEVAQRLSYESSGKSVSSTNYTGIDMFKTRVNSCTLLLTQSTTAPVGFTSSLKVDVTSADTSLASGVYNTIVGHIEGYDIARTAIGTSDAKTCTLSFYVRSNLTGTFTGSIGNSANDRSYAFDYTISAANTWERKTITFTSDSSGTYNKNQDLGLKVTWVLGVGSKYLTGTTGEWQADEHMGSTNGQNVVASTSNEFYLTGVQLELGPIATDFEHRSFCDEFRKCQRYYQKSRMYGEPVTESGNSWNTTEASLNQSKRNQYYDTHIFWPGGVMRSNPSLTFKGSGGTVNQHRFEVPGVRKDLLTLGAGTLTVNVRGYYSRLTPGSGTPDDNNYRSGSGNAFVRSNWEASAEY